MFVVRAVREVETRHVHACGQQPAQGGLVVDAGPACKRSSCVLPCSSSIAPVPWDPSYREIPASPRRATPIRRVCTQARRLRAATGFEAAFGSSRAARDPSTRLRAPRMANGDPLTQDGGMHALPFRADVPTARLAHDLPRNVSPQGSHAPSDDLPSSLQTHGGSPDGEKASNSEEIERPDETLRAAAKEETPANRSDTGGGLPTNPQHRRGLPNSMLFRHPRSRRKLGGHGARARRMRGWPLGRQARRMVRTPRSRAARAKRQTRPNECLNAHSAQMFT